MDYTEVKCQCGEVVVCFHNQFTNTCEKCGQDYDNQGGRLADRSQWGEETGETASDILGV